MKKKLTLAVLIGFSIFAQAQKNYIKTNLTSVAFNNYSFQYERTFARNFSASLSYRFMPATSLPFRNQISKFFDDYQDKETIKETVKVLQVDNYAITPEIRFYLKRAGKGFYVSAYYRYADFGLENYTAVFDKEDGSKGRVDLNGNFKINSGGVMIGSQWVLARKIVLDWWIVGIHFGSVKGTIKGYSSDDLSIIEQNEVKRFIEDFKYLDKVTVTDKNNVKVNFSGPWTGIRMGLSLGICF